MADLPQWLVEPGEGELVLIAKKGAGAEFPDYLEEALRRYEAEATSTASDMEGCVNQCTTQNII